MEKIIDKVFHISDCHLDLQFSPNNVSGLNFNTRREEIWETFSGIFNLAKKTGVGIILISGDLFENNFITITSIERLSRIFKSYPDIKVFISLGNHDHISEKSKYLKSIIPSNVFIFEDKLEYIQVDNFRIYGFSWSRPLYRDLEIDFEKVDDRYFNILLLHGMNQDNTDYLPLDINYLESFGFDYIGLGHIHIPCKVGEKTYYSGSIEPFSFKNLGPHGINLLNINMDKTYDVEFIDFAKRTYHIIDVDLSNYINDKNLELELNNKFKNHKADDIFRIVFKGINNSLNLNEIIETIKGNYPFLDFIDSSQKSIDIDDLIVNNKDNIIGKYFEFIRENFTGEEFLSLYNIGLETFPREDLYED